MSVSVNRGVLFTYLNLEAVTLRGYGLLAFGLTPGLLTHKPEMLMNVVRGQA